MEKSIELFAKKALPAFSASTFTYSAARNAFISTGYLSNAGNNYYEVLRLSKNLAIKYNIGEGICRTFLNGITIFAWSGNKPEIIAQRFWGGWDNWVSFSESFAKEKCVDMLTKFLVGQAKLAGRNVSERELCNYSRRMVNETVTQKLIA